MINLSTIIKSHTKISLKWTTTDTGITSFQVYRNGTLISTLTNPTATSYDDTGLSPSTSYTHRVDSLNSSGTVISQSNTITTTTYLWATTFDCPDWVQPKGSVPPCDGIDLGNRDYLCNGVTPSLINSDGNNPNGNGGKGFRVSIGDGQNNLSAFPSYTLSTPQSELWIRFYIKFPLGFAWSYVNITILYFSQVLSNHQGYISMVYDLTNLYTTPIGIPHNPDHKDCDNNSSMALPNFGWNDIMGGSTGDGQWHYYEFHIKKDTNGTNGIFQAWIDGILRNNHSDVNYNNSDFNLVAFNVGQNNTANNGCVYVDYDDIAISTTGYIGSVIPSCPQISITFNVS